MEDLLYKIDNLKRKLKRSQLADSENTDYINELWGYVEELVDIIKEIFAEQNSKCLK